MSTYEVYGQMNVKATFWFYAVILTLQELVSLPQNVTRLRATAESRCRASLNHWIVQEKRRVI